jgi:thioredoxin-related protein
MVKKAFITSGITIVFTLALVMVYIIIEKQTEKKEIQTKIQSIPVTVNLFSLDSTRFSFPEAKPIVMVLFNSTCEHCQYELNQINERIEDFNELDLVFLSSEPVAAIKQAAAPFESVGNATFIKINPEDVYENFGTIRFPTILIYNAQGKLVKEFKGETKIEAILQYARQ